MTFPPDGIRSGDSGHSVLFIYITAFYNTEGDNAIWKRSR